MKTIMTLVIYLLLSTLVYSANVKEYIDGPTGVTVKLNDDGTISSIVASGESELIFGDRKDERTATLKATLRAKANISKFMSERISTEEVMDDLTKIASEATADGKTPIASSTTRQTLETQREVIRNSSDSILKGLITLATDVNRDNKYVKVVLGTNMKLMKAADNLNTKMKQNPDDNNSGTAEERVINESGSAQSGREIRKSDALMDF